MTRIVAIFIMSLALTTYAIAAASTAARQEDWVLHHGHLLAGGKPVFLKIGKPLRNFAEPEACGQLAGNLDLLKKKGYNALELNCYWHHFDQDGDGTIDVSLSPMVDLIRAIHAKGMFPCLSVETYGVGGGQIPKGFWERHPDAVEIDSNGEAVRDTEYGFNTAVPSLFHGEYIAASRRFIRNLVRGLPHRLILHYETTVEPQFMGHRDIGYCAAAGNAYRKWLKHNGLDGPAWPSLFPVPQSFRSHPVWLRFRAESLADWVNKDAAAFRSVAGKDAYIAVDYLEAGAETMHKRNGDSVRFLTSLTCADIIQVNWHWHLGTRAPNRVAYDNVRKIMKDTGRDWAISEHMTLTGSDFRPAEVEAILTNALDSGTGYAFEFVNVAASTKNRFVLYNDDWSAKPLIAEVDNKWPKWQEAIEAKMAGE